MIFPCIAPFRLILTAVILASGAHAQLDGHATFEAASVKLSPPPDIGKITISTMAGGPGTADPGRIVYTGIAFTNLLGVALGVPHHNLIVPDWMNLVRVDVTATMDPATSKERFRMMLLSLLTERFGLVAHQEEREVQGFVLAVYKGSAKLTPVPEDAPPITDKAGVGPGVWVKTIKGSIELEGKHATIQQLTERLSGRFNRPVTDETGLLGTYDFVLSTDMSGLTDPGDRDAAVLHALQTQLGLTLKPKKLVVSVMVVDYSDRTPADN